MLPVSNESRKPPELPSAPIDIDDPPTAQLVQLHPLPSNCNTSLTLSDASNNQQHSSQHVEHTHPSVPISLVLQLVARIPTASIHVVPSSISSDLSAESLVKQRLHSETLSDSEKDGEILRPIAVTSIPCIPSPGLETEVLVQKVYMAILPPTDTAAAAVASTTQQHKIQNFPSSLEPHSVLLKRSAAVTGASSKMFKHEVALFKHAWAQRKTQGAGSQINHPPHVVFDTHSLSTSTWKNHSLLQMLSTHYDGVWGPIACVSADGKAVVDFDINIQPSTATVQLHQHIDSIGFDTTNQSQSGRRRHSKSLRNDTVGVVLPDIGGAVLSTLIRSWHSDSLSSSHTNHAASNASTSLHVPILEEILHCALALTDQLHRIHQLGIVLRSVRPSMITFSASLQQASFLDFSQATLLQREPAPWSSSGHLNVVEAQWPYMAPELTGRTNRLVDSRSDLYSLGMVIYTMLCGEPAFVHSNVITIIHEHVAGNIHWPRTLQADSASPHLGKSLAALKACVLKLLTKDPEERYQTAVGLQVDLAYCLDLCKDSPSKVAKSTHPPAFVPGRTDKHATFQISQKLYGRKTDIDLLLTIYASLTLRRRTGPQLLLIGGPSGIGKTALVNEVHLPMVKQCGLYCRTKFDLYQRNTSVIFEAFNSLLKQILASGELEVWRTQLLETLNDQSIQALNGMLPILNAVLGLDKHPAKAVDEAAPQPHTEAQMILQRALVSLVGVFATPSHPLVVFVDDLQWADATSLSFLKLLFSSPNLTLLVIGAYRTNEVDDRHPLMLMLDELRSSERLELELQQSDEQEKRVTSEIESRNSIEEHSKSPAELLASQLTHTFSRIHCMRMVPLTADDVAQLVAHSFHCDVQMASPLAELLHQQSRGNPFFLTALLHSYHQHGLIYFDYHEGEWQWQLSEMKVDALVNSNGNLVSLVEQQVKQLPLDQQQVLKVAACLGNRFNLEQLGICFGCDRRSMAKLVWPLLQTGFLIPVGSVSEVFALANSSSPTQLDAREFPVVASNSETSEFSSQLSHSSDGQSKTPVNSPSTPLTSEVVEIRFLHDSVQQASYQLLDLSARLQQHLDIARRLTVKLFGAPAQNAENGEFNKLLQRIQSTDEQSNMDGDNIHLAVVRSNPLVITITEQYNVCVSLLTAPAELRWVIWCNLQAGERARINTVFEHCHVHAAVAFSLLQRLVPVKEGEVWNDYVWSTNYRLSLNVFTFLAQAMYFVQRFSEAEPICAEIIRHTQQHMDETNRENAQATSDHKRALLISAMVYSAQPAQAAKCIEQTLLVLPLQHIQVLESGCPEWLDVDATDPMKFVDMFEATDKQHLESMRIMASILATMFVLGKHGLLRAVVHTMLHMSRCSGVSMYTSCALVYHGGTLCASEDPEDVRLCVRAGFAGMRLFDRFRHSPLMTGSMKARTVGVFYAICAPWGEHFKTAGPAQLRFTMEAVHDGEFEYSGYTLWHSCIMRWYSAEPLLVLAHDLNEIMRGAMQHGHTNQVAFCMYTLQLVQKMLLMHGPDDPFDINGKQRSTLEFADELLQHGVKIFVHFLLKNQLQVLYYSNDFARAAELVPKLASMRAATEGHMYYAMDLFFSALTLLRAVPITDLMHAHIRDLVEFQDLDSDREPTTSKEFLDQTSVARSRIEEYLPDILYSLRRTETWSCNAPMNFRHRVHLLKAELMRVKLFVYNQTQLIPRVLFHYRKAIEFARVNGFTQDKALASELEGRFFLELDQPENATLSLHFALRSYQQWQCRLKVEQLQREFGSNEKLEACARMFRNEFNRHSESDPDLAVAVAAVAATSGSTDFIYRDDLFQTASHHSNASKTHGLDNNRDLSNSRSASSYPRSSVLNSSLPSTSSSAVNAQFSSPPLTNDNALDVDFLTISNFTQMCSLESDPQALLDGIMKAVLRAAGATTATLVLKEIDKGEQWNVELTATLNDDIDTKEQPQLQQQSSKSRGVTLHAATMPVSADVIPMRLFRYVLNCKEPLSLSQPSSLSSESVFGVLASDPYFATHNPHAALCAPLLKSGSVIGVIYLESSNNARAFVATRIPFLQLLCSQAALSITNSRLFNRLTQSHSSLEDLVRVRTSEVSLRNEQLEAEVLNRKDAEDRMRAAKDEAEAAAKFKNDFLNNMTHEVRTPMNAVIGASRLLAETPLSLEQQQLLSMINVSGRLLLSIVNDILDFNKIEAQGVQLRLSTHNLADVVDAVMLQCFTLASAKKLTLEVFIDPVIPASLLVDSNRLQQVLLNFLSNAIKFTKVGGVELHVTGEWVTSDLAAAALEINRVALAPSEQPCVARCMELRFEVRDTGIGISPEQLSTLFQTFSQVRHNSSEFGGTGLGLVISKRLVAAMGGSKIDVNSALGHGSTFSFRFVCFPAKHPASSSVICDTSHCSMVLTPTSGSSDSTIDLYGFSHEDRVRLGRVTCLCIDMHARNASWSRLLKAYGCPISTFASVESAGEYLRNRSKSVVEQLDSAECGDVVIVDLDTLGVQGVQEQTVLDSLPLNNSRLRVLVVFSHLHQLSSPHLRARSLGDAARASQSSRVSTEIGMPQPGVATTVTSSSSTPISDSSSRFSKPICKNLQKPIRGSMLLHAVLELATKPVQGTLDSVAEGTTPPVPIAGASDRDSTLCLQLESSSSDEAPAPLLYVPQTLVNYSDVKATASPPSGPGQITNLASSCPLRILLAEDNVINQKMMVMLLRKLGYEILVATNGVEALKLLEQELMRGPQHAIECILMDASMDTMDGFECTRVIRAHQMPHNVRPFIIAQTANVTDDFRRRCTDAGMDMFLPKPIQIEMLAATLRAAYASHHAIATDGAATTLSEWQP